MKKIMIGLVLGLLLSFSFANADTLIKNSSTNCNYVGENLGEKVIWDGRSGIVHIGEVPQTQIVSFEKGKCLTDRKIDFYNNIHLYRINNSTSESLNMDKDARFDYTKDFIMSVMVDPITEKIEKFNNGMCIKAYDNWSRLVYNIDGKYKKLTGLIGFDYNLNKEINENYMMKIIVDGDIKQEIELKKSKYPQHIDIDVTNGKKLEIEFERPKGNKHEPFIDLVDMILE
ncbi:NPCBM/NEW2 domain-containing protein [Crassaminicella profunda]|uniref:NPCBM/NEW2 domain-containing protein n=1 Tax=Crassaminicella profunda TaxID=1286698 RepID=UPI001CA649A2|nr:NPCBM/NEW2 domain-containing protein [Crassaminicella profunda]QZY55494.1 NPCBM/NEW2 domain-containing protein [Crassaminicella profunda]